MLIKDSNVFSFSNQENLRKKLINQKVNYEKVDSGKYFKLDQKLNFFFTELLQKDKI